MRTEPIRTKFGKEPPMAWSCVLSGIARSIPRIQSVAGHERVVNGASAGGDVRVSVSGTKRGTPLWLSKAAQRSTPMSQQAATITSLPMALAMVKAMQADGLEWGEGYRPLARQALTSIIEEQMAAAVDRHLDQLGADDAPDRRNGHYSRHLLTTLGDIELRVPRTRRYSPAAVLQAYARREAEI